MAAGFAADRQPAVPETAGETGRSQRDSPNRSGTTIERFADELGLTESQRTAIAPVIKDTQRRMSELFEPVRPAYRELIDSARAQIEALLTPDQVAEYRRLLEREYGPADDGDPDGGDE
jgi:Spy/CpxP family protein refolding chaperone